MTNKISFNKRLQILITIKKIQQIDLVEATGFTESMVSHWLGGKEVNPQTKTLVKLVDYFGCDLHWLQTGEGEPFPEPEKQNFGPAPYPHNAPHRIPIISWVQAGDWQNAEDPFQPGQADEWNTTVETSHQNAFALIVKGDSMQPNFHENDIITVDPGREPISGDFIVAKNGNEATFKQLVIDGSSVFLKPLNTRYPIKDMTGIDFVIVGVIVEKRQKY